MNVAPYRPIRSAIVLAGGEGRHIRQFVHQIVHKDLPKQFVALIGTRSMLTHTYARAERIIPTDRIFTILGQDQYHQLEVRQQLSTRAPNTVIMEPAGRGTGPGVILPLLHIRKRHPGSTVAVLPSDHFVLQEDLFSAFLQEAFEIVEKDPGKIVFLGAEPRGPESEYGYILPNLESSNHNSRYQSILAFAEVPEPGRASKLISLGAFWNTSVMVFKVDTLLELVRLSDPELHECFRRIFRVMGTPYESDTVETVYADLKPLDFCKDLIGRCELYSHNQFSVIPMRGVFWSDWGCAIRILADLTQLKYLDRIPPAPRLADFQFNAGKAKLAANL